MGLLASLESKLARKPLHRPSSDRRYLGSTQIWRGLPLDPQRATSWAKKALYHMRYSLGGVQKNGPLIDAIDGYIKNVQGYVEAKASETFLLKRKKT
ncbi:hypothetical protein AUP68_09738 [Ilyonectria robusta]